MGWSAAGDVTRCNEGGEQGRVEGSAPCVRQPPLPQMGSAGPGPGQQAARGRNTPEMGPQRGHRQTPPLRQPCTAPCPHRPARGGNKQEDGEEEE